MKEQERKLDYLLRVSSYLFINLLHLTNNDIEKTFIK